MTPVMAMREIHDPEGPLRARTRKALSKISISVSDLDLERGMATMHLIGHFPAIPAVGVEMRNVDDWRLGVAWLAASYVVLEAGAAVGSTRRNSADGKIRKECDRALVEDVDAVVPKLREKALKIVAKASADNRCKQFLDRVRGSRVFFRAMQGNENANAFITRCMIVNHPDGPTLEELEREFERLCGYFSVEGR